MKTIVNLILCLAIANYGIAQANSKPDEATVADSLITVDSAVTKTAFTIGAIYGNNTSYYGQKPLEATPYIALAGTLKFPSGIYFTGTAYRLLKDSGSLASAGALGAGIEFSLGSKVTADINYSHTFYPQGSPFLQASNNNLLSAAIKYEYFLSSTISYDYAFGEEKDMFATFSTSKFIEFGNLFSKKDGFGLTPSFDVMAGTQHYYNSYVTNKVVRDNLAGLPFIPLPGTGSTVSDTTTEKETKFSLLSYSLRLPLSYYRSNYLIEAAYQLSFLSNKVQTSPGATNSFFTLSFFYQF